MKATACCDPAPAPGPEVRDPADDEALAVLAKAIAHPVRVQIVRMLAQIAGCVCGDIVDKLPLAQSTVSQHLKVLKDAGLVRGTIEGPRVSYCIDPQGLRRLRLLVAAL
jgi:ArsR family transcriptional regulator